MSFAEIRVAGYCSWPWWRRMLHIHRDPDWQTRGVWRYFECRCGARRVSRATRNLMGPSDRAWPSLRDRHGEHVDDTGWRLSW